MSPNPDRIASIDGLRGLLAAYVVIFHVFQSSGIHAPIPPGSIPVGIFFILSGYVLTPCWNGDYLSFLVRRLVRLWPVYAGCLVAGALIFGVKLYWTDLAFYPICPSDADMQIDPPIWSLHTEAWAMLAIPVIVWGGKTLPRTILTALAFALLSYFQGRLGSGALFVLGSYLSRYRFNAAVFNMRIPQFLGKISYSLYLSHSIVFKAFLAFAPSVSLFLVLPITVIVGYAVWAGVERHSIRLSRRAAAAFERASTDARARLTPFLAGAVNVIGARRHLGREVFDGEVL